MERHTTSLFFLKNTAAKGTFSKYIVKVRFHVFSTRALYDWMEAISLLIYMYHDLVFCEHLTLLALLSLCGLTLKIENKNSVWIYRSPFL